MLRLEETAMTDAQRPRSNLSIHMIAICGTGMGSLARLLAEAGHQVRGSDEAVYPPMSTQLEAAGIKITEGFRATNLNPRPDLVIVGNAVSRDNAEAARSRELGLKEMSFPQALAAFFLRDRHTITVAGTHGKTTTSGMVAWLLEAAGRSPGFLVGGVLRNFGITAHLGEGPHFVVEGDEYDSAYFDKRPKLFHYLPDTAILTSVEFDHADIFADLDQIKEAFRGFVETIPAEGLIIGCADDANVVEILAGAHCRIATYGMHPEADWRLVDLEPVPGAITGRIEHADAGVLQFRSPMAGRHNALNFTAAAAAVHGAGLSFDEIGRGIAGFKGMMRRQEVVGSAAGIDVIDDFAHHPTAVRETIAAIKGRYPGGRVLALFEPRTNTSRRKHFQREYAAAFGGADVVIIAQVHQPEAIDESERMDPEALARDIEASGTRAAFIPDLDRIVETVAEEARPGDAVLCMSSGAFGGVHTKILEALSKTTK